jgi:hypothetical protein
MRHRILLVLVLILLGNVLPVSALPSAQASPKTPVPKGERTLGLSVGPAADGDYPKALAEAQAAGVQLVTLSLDWSQLETAPGRYDSTWLTIADGFYPPRHVEVDLILRPIDTNHAKLPSDLAGKPFDDPAVIARFERLLDAVFAQIPNLTLHSLVIGNEVDAQRQSPLDSVRSFLRRCQRICPKKAARRSCGRHGYVRWPDRRCERPAANAEQGK